MTLPRNGNLLFYLRSERPRNWPDPSLSHPFGAIKANNGQRLREQAMLPMFMRVMIQSSSFLVLRVERLKAKSFLPRADPALSRRRGYGLDPQEGMIVQRE